MSWIVPKLWEGDECWIIGGGPSIPREFNIPNDVIEAVQDGKLHVSEYSKYMEFLWDKHVIGINAAWELGNWIDIVFFGDRGWYFKNRERLAEFPGMKVSCAPALNNEQYRKEGVKFLHRDRQGRGMVRNHKSVCWNSNSGAASLSLAASLGVNTIYLLGFDMDLDNRGRQHFHGMYGTRGDRRPAKKLPFARHMIGFQKIKQDAKRMRIRIINVNPNSKIEVFRKMSLKDVINEKKGKEEKTV